MPAVLLIAAGVLFGAAGCSGGSSSDKPAPTTTTDTASPLTKDELINDGDDICAEVNAAVGTISSSTTTDETIRQTQISDIYAGLAERLSSLGTPSDGEAPSAVIEATQGLAESTSADGGAALLAFQSAAGDYGFVVCAEAPAAPSSSGDLGSSGADPSTGVPVDPAPTPTPAPAPAPAPPTSGGGVVPGAPPSSGGGSSSGSGGISPG